MKKVIAVLLALTLLAGCTMAQQTEQKNEDTYQLYFAAGAEQSLGGDAIASESVTIEGSREMDPQLLAERIVQNMLAGPASETLEQVIPAGTSLLSLAINGTHATVDLSSAYNRLSGMALTMADYCLTLALTQLPEINLVSITVSGRELDYRDKQIFRARDVLLTTPDDVVGYVDVTLWFLREETGTLEPESRTLTLYEGETQAEVLVQALRGESEQEGLISALPEDLIPLSVWVSEGICYVNLPSTICDEFSRSEAKQVIWTLVNSLGSLELVDGVKIRVDGGERRFVGGVDISGILQPETRARAGEN